MVVDSRIGSRMWWHFTIGGPLLKFPLVFPARGFILPSDKLYL